MSVFINRLVALAGLAILLLGLLASPVMAITLEDAARQVARQHNARVLSARTVRKGQNNVHEIKVLTKDGVVKTVRVPAPPSNQSGNNERKF